MMNFNNMNQIGMNSQINMNFMNNNMNYNQINNNMNITNINSINMNNNLMNIMFQNMFMMQYFNNSNNNTTNNGNLKNNNEIKFNDKNKIITKRLLPKQDIIKGDYFYPEENKTHIRFITPSGIKIIVPSPFYLPINELIKNFSKKIGINEKDLKSLIFVYNAMLLDPNDHRSISSIYLLNGSHITVVEIDGINSG